MEEKQIRHQTNSRLNIQTEGGENPDKLISQIQLKIYSLLIGITIVSMVKTQRNKELLIGAFYLLDKE